MAKPGGDHFLLETNYDHQKKPSPIDDRRDAANDCMRTRLGGPSGYNFTGLYNVLQATPSNNHLTTFTTLMHAKTGRIEAYRQLCDDLLKCPLW